MNFHLLALVVFLITQSISIPALILSTPGNFFTSHIQELIEMLFPLFKLFFLCDDDFTIFRPCSNAWLLEGIRLVASSSCTALSDCFAMLFFPPLSRLFPRLSSCLLALSFSIPCLSSGTSAAFFPSIVLSGSS